MLAQNARYSPHEEQETSSDLRALWMNEDDPVPYAWHLFERGALGELAVFCRGLLEHERCPQRRAQLEHLLGVAGEPPTDWSAALEAFAAAPSLEAFEALFRRVPADDLYLRLREALQRLRTLGVDPDLLFECATRWGTTPDAIALAESGAASPEVIVARGEDSPLRPFWLALAARSAAARGQQVRAVWLAQRARLQIKDATNAVLVGEQIALLAEDLDAEHCARL